MPNNKEMSEAAKNHASVTQPILPMLDALPMPATPSVSEDTANGAMADETRAHASYQ
jgi:hypothetical protein